MILTRIQYGAKVTETFDTTTGKHTIKVDKDRYALSDWETEHGNYINERTEKLLKIPLIWGSQANAEFEK